MSEPTYEPAWPLDKLTPAPDNPRRDLGDLTELAKSISAVGIVEPLVVTTTSTTVEDGHLLIVAGHRRLAAAQKAGLTTAPLMVHQAMDDLARREIMLVENLQRSDLRTYQGLIELGVSQHQLAERIGRSQPHISRRLALLALPTEIVARVGIAATGPKGKGNRTNSTGISLEAATELLKLSDQPAALAEVVKEAKDDIRDADYIAQLVETKRHELEDVRKIEQWKAEAKKKGWPVIAPGRGGPTKYRKISTGAAYEYSDVLKVKLADHRKEPCHAVVITDGRSRHRQRASRTEVCADPSRHAKKGLSPLKQPVEPRRARSNHDQEQLDQQKGKKAAAARRAEFLPQALAKKVPTDEALTILARAVLDNLAVEYSKAAAGFLGIEEGPRYRRDLLDEAEEAKDLVRYAVAAALAKGHVDSKATYMRWSGPATVDLYGFLERRGYELDEFERTELGTARREDAEEQAEQDAELTRERERVIEALSIGVSDLSHVYEIRMALAGADWEALEEAELNGLQLSIGTVEPPEVQPADVVGEPADELEDLRARVIRNACLQTEDMDEQQAIAETLRDADEEFLEQALEQFPDPVDELGGDKDSATSPEPAEEQSPGLPVEGNGDVAELPEVTIRKSGKKWITVCSGCREEIGRNTSEAFAEDMRRAHLEVVHGAAPAADAAAS